MFPAPLGRRDILVAGGTVVSVEVGSACRMLSQLPKRNVRLRPS